ncbi:OPA3-like protein isoform X1 [Hibiscus syriacus]|uniref:OPA3-like protein isoform X1 n=1 Tax=Hibiscus syriacus TaxID=106335 RepID=UPI001924A873|nr:OPA3-like protein isoform X1 [Hibiscus syriacus]
MSLQLLKLGTLALKTLSKSVASRLKRQAAYAPKFRQFIVSIAQANHRITTRMQRRIYSHATDVEIRPLDEEKAVQAAVDLIGELFVFTISNWTMLSPKAFCHLLPNKENESSCKHAKITHTRVCVYSYICWHVCCYFFVSYSTTCQYLVLDICPPGRLLFLLLCTGCRDLTSLSE